MTEVSLEDRPTKEQIANDQEFDNWLEYFERKQAQKHAKYTRKT